MRFVDIFCGIGTIRMGMEMAGHECVYSIEWDKFKRKIYSIIFGEEPEGGDIRSVKANDIPRADAWCFGFPCQDISVAGKQLGFNGERSSLFFEVMRLLSQTKEEDRPRYLLIENVKNLFSVNKGWDFFNLLYTLDEIGYDAEWQLINSKGWVPQNRERIFIVGHFRGRCTRKVFPIKKSNSKTLKRIIGGSQGYRVYSTEGLSCTLQSNAGGLGGKTGLYLIGNVNPSGRGISGNVYDSQGLSPTLTASDWKEPKKCLVRAVLTPDRMKKRQNGRRMKEPGEPMFTLTKQDRHGVMIAEATKKGYAVAHEGDSINIQFPGSKTRRGRVGKGVAQTLQTSCNQGTLVEGRIRRLTPKECWRLQSIDDEITDKVKAAGISDTQMYRAAGDACTVEVIYQIGKQMKEEILEEAA